VVELIGDLLKLGQCLLRLAGEVLDLPPREETGVIGVNAFVGFDPGFQLEQPLGHLIPSEFVVADSLGELDPILPEPLQERSKAFLGG
jgi:hypothetical protein